MKMYIVFIMMVVYVLCGSVVIGDDSSSSFISSTDPVYHIKSTDPTIWNEPIDKLFPPIDSYHPLDDPFFDMEKIRRDFGDDDDVRFNFREVVSAEDRQRWERLRRFGRRIRSGARAVGRRIRSGLRRAAGHIRRGFRATTRAVRDIFSGRVVKKVIKKLGKYVKEKFIRAVKWAKETSKEFAKWMEANVIRSSVFRRQCRIYRGNMVIHIRVSKCTGGKARISWEDSKGKTGSQEQKCKSGTGYTYDKDMCYFKTASKKLIYFDDGASQPWLADKFQSLLFAPIGVEDFKGFNMIFWQAGQQHDYCYHHQMAYPKHSRLVCDRNFLQYMGKVCRMRYGRAFNQKRCLAVAHIMYGAVRVLGKSAYDYMNTDVNYPLSLSPPPLARRD